MANVIIHDEQVLTMGADAIDVALAGSNLALNPTAGSLSLHSIDPNGIGEPGFELWITNDTATPVTLKHNSGSGTAGMRLFFSDNADHVLGAYGMVWAGRKERVAGRVGWWVEIPA